MIIITGASDCTMEDLKQCNRWFIDAFGEAGEKVVLIEDNFMGENIWISLI